MKILRSSTFCVATMVMGAALGQASPGQAMPILSSATNANPPGGLPAQGFLLKVQHDADLSNSGSPGTPAYAIGQADARRRAYGGAYGGGWGRGPYGAPYAPRRGAWCYNHPYQCR